MSGDMVIAVSLGDPVGIGPEVIVRALLDDDIRNLAKWVIVGDKRAVQTVPEYSQLTVRDYDDRSSSFEAHSVYLLDVRSISESDLLLRGPNASCGAASLEFIRAATDLCKSGTAQALVTGPVSKEAVTLAGKQFTGHTEYLAELCGVQETRMLLVNDRLRVVHVTTHCSLAEATSINTKRVLETICLGHQAMAALGSNEPRIAVCGLNPHAGENGLFGNQEAEAIVPAIESARDQGIDCSGPLPADTLFLQAYRGKYDLVVAMYHDQGHVPMKLLDFEHTVNISLGLPIVRTSVDHGTAYDIAGKQIADESDMKSAMRFAVKLVEARITTT